VGSDRSSLDCAGKREARGSVRGNTRVADHDPGICRHRPRAGRAASSLLAERQRVEKDAADMAKRMNMLMLALAMLPGLALADCFRANQDDGKIEFTGVAEGSAFTGHFGEFEVS